MSQEPANSAPTSKALPRVTQLVKNEDGTLQLRFPLDEQVQLELVRPLDENAAPLISSWRAHSKFLLDLHKYSHFFTKWTETVEVLEELPLQSGTVPQQYPILNQVTVSSPPKKLNRKT
jgi:hypothetical protein